MRRAALEDFYYEQLQLAYWTEKALVAALPGMAMMSKHPELRNAFVEHAEETRSHVRRLERCFEIAGRQAESKRAEGVDALLREGSRAATDAGLIAAAQRVEHYEMATYMLLSRTAKNLGYHEAGGLHEETLDEEREADRKLTVIAERSVNKDALPSAPRPEEDNPATRKHTLRELFANR